MSRTWTVTDSSGKKVTLVEVTNRYLGLPDVLPQHEQAALRQREQPVPPGATLEETIAAAATRGLAPCRPGLAPALRIVHPQATKEETGECLLLVTDPTATGHLETVHNDSKRHYAPGRYACSLKAPVYPNARFVFEQAA